MNVPGIVVHRSAQPQLDAFLASPSHALLLAGAKGCGKMHIATAIARELLSTKTLEREASYQVVRPEKGSISIENIRVLAAFFQLKVPGKGAIKRVAIIEDADNMGTEAQNALLKLLEEPPADSVLILTSSRPQSLLITIRSRVQLIKITNPTVEALTQHFMQLGYSAPLITSVLMRSGTDVAEATRRLMEEQDVATDTITLVKQALSGGSYARLLFVDNLSRQRAIAEDFVNVLTRVATASLESAAHKNTTNTIRWHSILQAAHTAEEALNSSGSIKLALTELMLNL